MEQTPTLVAVAAIALTLALCSCSPKFTTRELPKPKKAPEGTVFLVQRYSQTTDTGIVAFDPGTEADVESKRPGFVTLTVGNVKFEMPSSAVTDDLATRDELVAQTAALLKDSSDTIEANRLAKIERTKAQQIASVKDIKVSKIQRLKDEIKSSQVELNTLNAAYQSSVNSYYTSSTGPSSNYTGYDSFGNPITSMGRVTHGSNANSPENTARRDRIATINAYIAQCQSELTALLSDPQTNN